MNKPMIASEVSGQASAPVSSSTLDAQPIRTGAEYVESLRNRNLTVYLMGELVGETVDHPIIRPSINAVAATYDLAVQNPELASELSPLTGERVNRFLHIAGNTGDLVMQNKMQRRLGQLTGTCFQRCVGMDALNALHSVTYEIDQKQGTGYHEPLSELSRQGPAPQSGHRRGHDRRQGRPQQVARGAGRSRSVRHVTRRTDKGRPYHRRQSASDRMPEFALADGHADHAARRGGPRLRDRGGTAGRRQGHHLHLRPAVLRYPQRRRRRDSTPAMRTSPARKP